MTYFIPLKNIENWRDYLGDPKKHWKTGRSAKLCAETWFNASGFPEQVKTRLDDSGIPDLQNLELVMGFPELQVSLPPTSGHPSQNDIWILAKSPQTNQLISISVEAKVTEPFGPTVKEWITKETSGKTQRLQYICNLLNIKEAETPGIRYQLLHRTASALIMAEKLNTQNAMTLIHSFDPDKAGYQDYQQFCKLLEANPNTNVTKSKRIKNKNLYLTWITQTFP